MKKNIPRDIVATFEGIQALQIQIGGLNKRETQEKQNLKNYLDRISKLERLAVQSLSGNDKDFSKYKTSIKKLNEQLLVSREILEKTKDVKKAPESELRTLRYNLPIMLSNYIMEYRRLCDAELQPKLDSLMTDVEFFLNDCKEIYQDFGLFFAELPHLIPLGIPEDFLADYRKKKAAKKPEPESTHTAPVEVQAPSPEQQDVVTEPSDGETPTEGTSIPPEPISQPEAALEATNEQNNSYPSGDEILPMGSTNEKNIPDVIEK